MTALAMVIVLAATLAGAWTPMPFTAKAGLLIVSLAFVAALHEHTKDGDQ